MNIRTSVVAKYILQDSTKLVHVVGVGEVIIDIIARDEFHISVKALDRWGSL